MAHRSELGTIAYQLDVSLGADAGLSGTRVPGDPLPGLTRGLSTITNPIPLKTELQSTLGVLLVLLSSTVRVNKTGFLGPASQKDTPGSEPV